MPDQATQQITQQSTSAVGRQAPVPVEPPGPALPDYFTPPDETPVAVPAELGLAPAPAAPAQHPQFLVATAQGLGIPADDIKGATTAELQRLVAYVSRQVANENRLLRQESAVSRQPPPPAAPVAPAEDEDEAALRELQEDLDPRLMKVLQRSIAWKKKAAELEGQLGQVRQSDQEREARSVYDTLDGAFEALGPEYEHLFGQGAAESLAPDSAELRRRLAAIRDTGLDLRKASPRLIAQKIKAAATSLFGPGKQSPYDPALNGVPPAVEPAKPAGRPKRPDGTFMSDAEIAAQGQWRNGALARPTQRLTPPEPDGAKKATASVSQLLEEMAATETQQGHSSSVRQDDFPD